MGGECRMAGVAVSHTNFARATPTFCPFIIIGHTNFELLVNHIMFWPHQLWKPSSAHAAEHNRAGDWVLVLSWNIIFHVADFEYNPQNREY